MYRFNIFHHYHDQLKSLVFELSLQFTKTDLNSSDDLELLIKNLNEAIQFFKKHKCKENEYILPLVFDSEPSVWDVFQQEYEKEILLLLNFENSINAIDMAKTLFDLSFAAKRLQSSFYHFAALVLDHILKEEDILRPILERYYSDAILIAIQQRLFSNCRDIDVELIDRSNIVFEENSLELWLHLAKNTNLEAYHQTLLSMVEKGYFKSKHQNRNFSNPTISKSSVIYS